MTDERMPHYGPQNTPGRPNAPGSQRSRVPRKKGASKKVLSSSHNVENDVTDGFRGAVTCAIRKGLQPSSGKANTNANTSNLAPKASLSEPSFAKKGHRKARGNSNRHLQPSGGGVTSGSTRTSQASRSLDVGERLKTGVVKRQSSPSRQGNWSGPSPNGLHGAKRSFEGLGPYASCRVQEGANMIPTRAFSLPVLPVPGSGLMAQRMPAGHLYMPVMYMNVGGVQNCVVGPLPEPRPRCVYIQIEQAEEKSFHADGTVGEKSDSMVSSPYSSSCASTASDASDEEETAKEQVPEFEESEEDRKLLKAIEASYRKADEELTRHAERSKEKAMQRWLEYKNREQQMQKNMQMPASRPQLTTAV